MIKKINLDTHVHNSDILSKIGGDRRCYVVLYANDYATNIDTPCQSVEFCEPIQKILNCKTSVLNLSFVTLPSDDILQLCDEIILPKGQVLDTPFVNTRFEKCDHKDKTIYFQRMLDMTKLSVFKNVKPITGLLETITGKKWEPWHKAHFYRDYNLLLQVLWDRREIMSVTVISEDDAIVLMQANQDDDNLVRYTAYEQDIVTLQPVAKYIDFVIDQDFSVQGK
jgi:hypothetical protein